MIDGETNESDAPANSGIDEATYEFDRNWNWPTRRVKRLPARERYIISDVPFVNEGEMTEGDAPADSDINAPRVCQRRRQSPPENRSFDAAMYEPEGDNFDNHLSTAAADLAEIIEFMEMPPGNTSASASSQQSEQGAGAVLHADGLGAMDASQSVMPGTSEVSELVDDTDAEVAEVSLGDHQKTKTLTRTKLQEIQVCTFL